MATLCRDHRLRIGGHCPPYIWRTQAAEHICTTQAEALVSGHAGGNDAMIARPSWGLGGLGRTPLRRLRVVVSGVETALRQQAGVERHAEATPFLIRGPSFISGRMLCC